MVISDCRESYCLSCPILSILKEVSGLMKILACSIIVLAGAACFSCALFANQNATGVGILVMMVGGFLFIMEYFGFGKSPE